MVITVKNDIEKNKLDELVRWLEAQKLGVHISRGAASTIIGLIGDTSRLDTDLIQGLPSVENVTRVSDPFKNANRKFHPENTVITVGNFSIGSGKFAFFAGPACISGENGLFDLAAKFAAGSQTVLKGGIYNHADSPYSFGGPGKGGAAILSAAGKKEKLLTACEIDSVSDYDAFEDIDIICVGSRNMRNYRLLDFLGKKDKPVILRRGAANTVNELLISADYIMAGGNEKVILCERGIRTFETGTKSTLDVSAVALIKKLSHLPVIVDPSRAVKSADLIAPLCFAAAGAGADGIWLDVLSQSEKEKASFNTCVAYDEFMKIKSIAEKISALAQR